MTAATETTRLGLDSDGPFPTDEEMEAAWTSLADTMEFWVDPLADRVHRTLNRHDQPGAVAPTLEQTGRLVLWLYHMDIAIDSMKERVDSIRGALPDIASWAKHGEPIGVPLYDERGKLS